MGIAPALWNTMGADTQTPIEGRDIQGSYTECHEWGPASWAEAKGKADSAGKSPSKRAETFMTVATVRVRRYDEREPSGISPGVEGKASVRAIRSADGLLPFQILVRGGDQSKREDAPEIANPCELAKRFKEKVVAVRAVWSARSLTPGDPLFEPRTLSKTS